MIFRLHHLPLISALIPLVLAETSKPNTGDQPQAFTFSYPSSPSANSVIIPITPSCPSPLIVSGLTTTNNPRSADPVAPYTLLLLVHEQLMDGAGLRYERMYARSVNIGNMAAPRSIENVWANGTQFIGCVWSSNGVSGGCQDLMTVANSEMTASAYANATSQCRIPSVMGSWVTPSSSTLDVTVEHSAGILASNGWPASCSDLRVTPKNGTGPYTLLIAPAFHPPVNITSATGTPMNYTIRLTHGQAFMLGVFDSAGNSFAYGPLHAGKADDLGCLAVATGQELPSRSGGIGTGIFAGGIAAAFLVGAAGAALVLWGFVIRKRKTNGGRDKHDLLFDEALSTRTLSYRVNSNQSYNNSKPLDPYEDSPQRGGVAFDSPDTLYDPYVGGTGSSSWLSPPPGDSSVVPGRTDFGPGMFRTESRDDPNMDIHTPTRKSQHSDPRHRSFPSSSSGLKQHRMSSSHAEASSPPALRLVGTPIANSSDAWDEGSDGEEYGDPYRSAKRGGKAGGRDRPRSHQRPQSGGINSQEEHEIPGRARKVYVVHSDGGGGDVHIQLPDGGARVIELPPGYRAAPAPQARAGDRDSYGARPRSGDSLSPEGRPTAHFGPRGPRPTSSTSQNSIPQRSTNISNPHLPPSASQTSLASAQPLVHRSKSSLERAEAAYLDLDLADGQGAFYDPLSPPLPQGTGSPPGIGMRANDSRLSLTGSLMTPEEIRARAEAAMAEKEANG